MYKSFNAIMCSGCEFCEVHGSSLVTLGEMLGFWASAIGGGNGTDLLVLSHMHGKSRGGTEYT